LISSVLFSLFHHSSREATFPPLTNYSKWKVKTLNVKLNANSVS
jgi:hypothetical protein